MHHHQWKYSTDRNIPINGRIPIKESSHFERTAGFRGQPVTLVNVQHKKVLFSERKGYVFISVPINRRLGYSLFHLTTQSLYIPSKP